jgi:IS5 family transposase
VIEHCKRIAKKEDITLKRTYTFEIRKLKQQLRFARKPKNPKKHIKSQKKLHGIAFKIYRDRVNQLNPILKSYKEEFDILYRVLTQQRDDKNKVYSIHEPEVLCISKGKEHKQYEFGNKSSFAYTRGSGIIVGAMAIDGNAYDGYTLKPQLEQVKELTGGRIKKAIIDKGCQVKGEIQGPDIIMPKNLKRGSYYLKKKREKRCRSRAGIEGLISHLKHDHRMIRNYLSGTAGDQINTLLAATAYNMKKVDEVKERRITQLNFTLDLPDAYFGSVKYPTLTKQRKTRIDKDQLKYIIFPYVF